MTHRQTISAVLSAVLLLTGCGKDISYSEDISKALEELDHVIAQKELIEAQKEERIAQIKDRLANASDDRERYGLMDNLVNEYFQYNIDSTAFLSRAKLEIAQKTGDKGLILDAIYDIADRHTMSGLADATFSELQLIEPEKLSDAEKIRYYSILNTIYGTMELETVDKVLAREYSAKKNEYRKRLLSSLTEEDVSRIYVMTEILLQSNRPQEALELLIQWVNEKKPSLDESGILCYSIASAYAMLEDFDQAILWYARSARCDLLVPKYEYRSLYELAGLLNKKGDIERAYSYITRSIDDAVQSNAQIHRQFAYQLLPIISSSYDSLMQEKNSQMRNTLIAMGIILGMLAIMSLVLLREKKRVTIAERQTKDSNEQLRKLNAELHDYVLLLQETNEIKDSYLGRYLNMCSDYIDGLDRYRSSLRKTGKEGGDIMAALKSKAFMEAELEEFYTQFDATFLDLFPDFIPQLNELLQEDKRISFKPKARLLTTELRVLALIRLGVNDSARIAQFLRRSVSTIYNYRVKMRNAAKVDREDFENRLMKIGKKI